MKFSYRTRFVLSCSILLGLWSLAIEADQPESSTKRHEIQIITNSIGMKLARIPAGKFVMGSPRTETERDRQELAHDVVITRPFYMGIYEVTQREFYHLVTGDRIPRASFTENNGGGPNHPMENASSKDAALFCDLLSNLSEERRAGRTYRLPTEAEWEYACRTGTDTAFHFGPSLSSRHANFNGNYPYGNAPNGTYLRQTTKVGSYEPNAFGLYDMHGNVSEWCADWYDEYYYRDSPEEDPLGPPVGVLSTDFDGDFYVTIRGGSWVDDARACRSAYRYRAMPNEPYRIVGFRVVCESEDDIAN